MANVTLYLPKNTKPSLKEGDPVAFGQLLTGDDSSTHIVISLGKLLGISPKDTGAVLRKYEGERVERGEVVAVRKGFFGSKAIKAPIAGRLSRVDTGKGEVTLSPIETDETTVVSPVAGRVAKITGEEIAIAFDGTILFAKQGIGSMRKGLLSLMGRADEEVLLSAISDKLSNNIVLSGYMQRQVLEKAYGIGVASIIVTELDEGDLSYFEHQGSRMPSLLVVATVDYELLKQYEGKEVVTEGMHKRIIIL